MPESGALVWRAGVFGDPGVFSDSGVAVGSDVEVAVDIRTFLVETVRAGNDALLAFLCLTERR
ncbi:hypothetical protein ACFV4N_03015 [Actinosynnema sp. NPDC059797]